MACEICGGTRRHHPRCPYFENTRPHHYCSICDEGIHNGEEFIVNDKDEYAHWECVDYARDLAKFLGYTIKEEL